MAPTHPPGHPGVHGASTDVCAACPHTRRWHGVHGCDECGCTRFIEETEAHSPVLSSSAPLFDAVELEAIADGLDATVGMDTLIRAGASVRTGTRQERGVLPLSPDARQLYRELAARARREAARRAAA